MRFAHAALRALNVEFDRVRATVSNEDLARLRLTFFRGALCDVVPPLDAGKETSPSSASSSASPPESLSAPSSVLVRDTSRDVNVPPALPVLDCLAEAVAAFPSVDFTQTHDLLAAREAFLQYPSFDSVPSLAVFASAPHRPLLSLHAMLLNAASFPQSSSSLNAVATAVQPAATAVGLAILLRAAPVHAASRLSYMPRGALSTSQLLSMNSASAPVFRGVAQTAIGASAQALSIVRTSLPKALRPAFWPVHLAGIYLHRLVRANYDPFDPHLVAGLRTTWHLAVQLRLLRARIFGT